MQAVEIKERSIALIAEMFSDAGVDLDVLEYVDLIDDLGMESITFISLVVELEERFGIEVPDDKLDMENFRNVDNMTDLIISVIAEDMGTKHED